MKNSNNIYLIGPMGAGKTTVGRMLAKSLGMAFFDSDAEIETCTGVDIPLIFEYEKEEGFRKREQETILKLCQLDNIVLATGGGVILNPENRDCLYRNGLVIYLKCSIERQLERTRNDSNRPLLHTKDPRKCLIELMQTREPLYLECADSIVDTSHRTSRAAVRDILGAYNSSLDVACST